MAERLTVEEVPVDTLTEFPGNPRRGDVDAVARSLERFDQYRPIVVNARTKQILAGNHTWKAARQLGWTTIAVQWVDADEAEAKAIVLADNRTSDLGAYDDEDLAAMLASVAAADAELLAATSYTDEDLAQLLAGLADPWAAPDADDAGDVPDDPVTQLGDRIVLGAHRLVCGSATDPGAWDWLCADTTIDCVWTDPPYGVAYVGKTAEALTIDNDRLDPDALYALLDGAFAELDAHMAPGARVYVAHPAGPLAAVFMRAVVDRWRLHQQLVWVKDSMVLGHADYHYRHEPILLAYKPGDGRWGRGSKGWYGDNSETSVLEYARPKRSAEHPTMKPVELVERMLTNSCAPGQTVADPFCGSGSTLLAAERRGAACVATELSPGYCDVIVDRWEKATGEKAVLVSRARDIEAP